MFQNHFFCRNHAWTDPPLAEKTIRQKIILSIPPMNYHAACPSAYAPGDNRAFNG